MNGDVSPQSGTGSDAARSGRSPPIATPDTILRWHRERSLRNGCTSVAEVDVLVCTSFIRVLVVRMATKNATWGYTRYQGA